MDHDVAEYYTQGGKSWIGSNLKISNKLRIKFKNEFG
jgi:hypothetical protein